MNISDAYAGCLMGLAVGDAVCAPFEGGVLERWLWKVIGKTKDGKRRYTDDTQMAIDTARSLIENNGVDQNDLAKKFADSYRWSRGYGKSTSSVLKMIRNGIRWQDANRAKYAGGSYGNGAAMRAPAVALFCFGCEDEMIAAVHSASEVTHAHPLAVEGATLTAIAVQNALTKMTPEEIIADLAVRCENDLYKRKTAVARHWIRGQKKVPDHELIHRLGNSTEAVNSCITAIYIALRNLDNAVDVLLNAVVSCRGDTDTIGAMAGAIWGAYNGIGKISADLISGTEESGTIIQLSRQLYEKHRKKQD